MTILGAVVFLIIVIPLAVFTGFGVAKLIVMADKWLESDPLDKWKSNKKNVDFEVRMANSLMKCRKCERYSRSYQQYLTEIQLSLKEEIKYWGKGWVCPHCYNRDPLKMGYTNDSYKWLDTHPDCPKIGNDDYKKYMKTLEEGQRALYEMESIDAFKKYNGFD